MIVKDSISQDAKELTDGNWALEIEQQLSVTWNFACVWFAGSVSEKLKIIPYPDQDSIGE